MKQTILACIAALASLSAQAQTGVETVDFGLPVHAIRIYGDTIFAATDASIHYCDLKGNKGPVYALDVVSYDLVKSGDRFYETGDETERLSQHPLCPDCIYLSRSHRDGTMGYTLSRSADFGRTWWTTGLHELQLPGRPQLAFNPLDADEIIVYGMNEYVDCVCPWMLRSHDGLETLQNVDFQMSEDRMDPTVVDVAFSPAMSGLLLMATTSGLARSTDGGDAWTYVDPSAGFFCGICFDDEAPHVAYAAEMLPMPTGSEGYHTLHYNICRSDDDGLTWTVIATASQELSARPTTGLCNLQCHGGVLFWRIGSRVSFVRQARSCTPVTNGVERVAVDGAAAAAAYDLLGRRTAAGRFTLTEGRIHLR